MKILVSLSSNIGVLTKHIGRTAFLSISSHPWYCKYLESSDTKFQVVDDGAFYRVYAYLDDRMFKFDVSRSLNKVTSSPGMFKKENGAWKFKWSYADVEGMR